MTIKEEEDKDDVKDELAALDALEKEASEFNKASTSKVDPSVCQLTSYSGCRNRPYPQVFQIRCVRIHSP